MKKIKLFIDPILYYMEDNSVFAGSHYIDLFEGEIISPDVDDISREDVENEDRYFYIEPITSHEGYEIIQDLTQVFPLQWFIPGRGVSSISLYFS